MSLPEITIIEQADARNLRSGGIDTIIHDLIKFNPSRRFAIVGATSDKKSELGSWQTVKIGDTVVQFLPVCRIDKDSRRRLSLPDSLNVALGALRFLTKFDRQHIHVHRVELGFLASFFRPQRLVQFIHNDSQGLLGSHSDSVWRHIAYLYYLLEKWAFRKADKVVLFNKSDGKRISKWVEDLIVAETWFDPAHFYMGTSDGNQSRLRVCWVGRMESQKDPGLAVEVFAELKKLVPDCEMAMVGSGSLLANVSSQASDLGVLNSIEFTGNISRAEVGEILQQGSVMLMTSHYEGSPTVLIEAAAIGLPVVATSQSDPDGVVIPGMTGELSSSRNARELAAHILRAAHYDRSACREQIEYRSAPVAVPRLLEATEC